LEPGLVVVGRVLHDAMELPRHLDPDAALIFDRLRRAELRNRTPINLVLEEAHQYVAERPSGSAIGASRIFQRIAKDGRKYGLFLIRR
jgi:hypothetical protein